jgi:hypothetical protein
VGTGVGMIYAEAAGRISARRSAEHAAHGGGHGTGGPEDGGMPGADQSGMPRSAGRMDRRPAGITPGHQRRAIEIFMKSLHQIYSFATLFCSSVDGLVNQVRRFPP